MSYHVLHVLRHGAVLSKEAGFIECKSPDGFHARVPHEDIRAIIIAARGVTLTSSCISAVLQTDGIILHCDESYQPCGITAPLSRVVDSRAYLTQAERPKRLNNNLWHVLLRAKTRNQHRVLRRKDLRSPEIETALRNDSFDEGNCAKRYWQLYFPAIGWASSSRDRRENTAPNQMLNYGYAVLAALCHRSLIVHGLSPLLGVKHTTRYHANPLVYDLMEPFRPYVDLMLAEYMVQQEVSMKGWCKTVGTNLREFRVRHGDFTVKLMDAIDLSVVSLAQSYAQRSHDTFWTPEIPSGRRNEQQSETSQPGPE